MTLRRLLAIAAFFVLLGCSKEKPEMPPLLAEQPVLPDGLGGLRELSGGGSCPTLSGPGGTTMDTGGGPRAVTWLYDEAAAPRGERPLLIVFHGLGGSGRSMVGRMKLQDLARSGVVVAIPEGVRTARLGWGAGPEGLHDAMLVDDIRHCAHTELGVDLARVHATGFSAGGLWTTLLSMHAADLFASVTVYSGGELTPFVTYRSPAHKLPALVIWGGTTDTYRGRGFSVAFDAPARRYSEALAKDGHLVVRCDHGGGHVLPTSYAPLLHAWTLSHRFGAPAMPDGWSTRLPMPRCELVPDR